jgi:hypothetical protein
MALDKETTPEQDLALEDALQRMSIKFRDARFSDAQLEEYFDDLLHYHGFTYTFPRLLVAIRRARQKFAEPGPVIPKVSFIMSMIRD